MSRDSVVVVVVVVVVVIIIIKGSTPDPDSNIIYGSNSKLTTTKSKKT